jgi:hypothetical protein
VLARHQCLVDAVPTLAAAGGPDTGPHGHRLRATRRTADQRPALRRTAQRTIGTLEKRRRGPIARHLKIEFTE